MVDAPRGLYPALVYAALATAVVSSLGMLLVPIITREMGVPAGTAQWIITGNLLVGAMTAPTMGRLADGARKKSLLILILIVALFGSVVAAVAPSFSLLLAGRMIQGIAYGIVPITITVARQYLPRERRAIAIATLSITVSMGIGIGYPLTGIIVGLLGLPAAFWMSAIFMVSALVVVGVWVPTAIPTRPKMRPFDWCGAMLLTLALAGVVIGVSEGPVLGWGSYATIAIFAVSITAGILWVATSRRAKVPFVDIQSIRIPDVLTIHVGSLALAGTIYLAMSTSSMISQAPTKTGYGLALHAEWAGFVIMPLALGSFAASRVLGLVMRRMALFDALILGSVSITFGQLFLLFFYEEIWQLFVGMFVVGVGMGTVFGVAPVIVARNVALEEVGSAVSFNQVLRTIGGTIGSAVAGSAFAAAMGGAGFPSRDGIDASLMVAACAAVVVTFGLLGYRILQRTRS